MVESVVLKNDEVATDAVDSVHACHVLLTGFSISWPVLVDVIVTAMRTSPAKMGHGLVNGSKGIGISLGHLLGAGTVQMKRREDDVCVHVFLFFLTAQSKPQLCFEFKELFEKSFDANRKYFGLAL